jgi:3-dehydroquinate synthase
LYPVGGKTDYLPPALVVCDENTAYLARKLALPALILSSGEKNKTWSAVKKILAAARKYGFGRDGLFVGIGGGALCDLCAFASSLYMRGAMLALIPTTLLAMADAAFGGKTGIDVNGIKNLAGTFYPASIVFTAAETLNTLPEREWKSGMAELIKMAILDREPAFFESLVQVRPLDPSWILPVIEKAVLLKSRFVEADPHDSSFLHNGFSAGNCRALLNLGHTFGHALESSLGLGKISHGEAVAWGLARACELGLKLGITPPARAKTIHTMLSGWGFEINRSAFTTFLQQKNNNGMFGSQYRKALHSDKKQKAGKFHFVVPAEKGAVLIEANNCVIQYLDSLMDEMNIVTI